MFLRINTFMALNMLLLSLAGATWAKPVCVEVKGEGAIINGDIPSASVEAVNRAKWSAVEQVAGVDVKSKTIIENFALLDDVITTRSRGVISSFRLLSEKRASDHLQVKINACVEPVNARSTVSSLDIMAVSRK